MPEATWIDDEQGLAALGRALAGHGTAGLDTEFLRERTFFPKLCLLQVAAGGQIWCVDTLRLGRLEPLAAMFTAAATRKVLHAARQDMEAIYLTARCVLSPVFDTQIAAGCVGLKPQMGYAELVKTLLDVTLPKGQTRTDWSRRPLTREQLRYAAEDVLYLDEIAARLEERLRALGREHWAREDSRALEDPRFFEPDPDSAWERLRGIAQLEPRPRARAKVIAAWRERLARERDLPRSWVLADELLFAVAHSAPASREALAAVPGMPANFNQGFAASLLEALHEPLNRGGEEPQAAPPMRPTPEQKALIDRLATLVDARARDLQVSAEILAPRGELKALALGARATCALHGWRRAVIGEALLEALD